MILDRLIELRNRLDDQGADIVPVSYETVRVRWILAYSPDGEFTGLIETGAKKKEWSELAIPYRKRSGTSTPPYLLVDKPEYVLRALSGEPTWGAKRRAVERHQAYLQLVADAAEVTGDENLAVLHNALSDREQRRRACAALAEQKWKADDLIVPRVGEAYPHKLRSVQQFWADRMSAKSAAKSRLTSHCLYCGKAEAIQRTHPVKLKLGGQTPELISMNEPAFRSYGLKQSENAPLCSDCARSYGEALRFLLQARENHLAVGGGTTWLFWTREPAEDDFASLFSNPQPDQVAALLTSARRGNPASVDHSQFYALVVSVNISRLIIRSWLEQPLPEARRHLADYFLRQRVLNHEGQAPPLSLFQLCGSLVPWKKGKPDYEKLPPQTPDLLLRHALTGAPLPPSLLHQALRRMHAERDPVTRRRAALIRLTLESNGTMTSEALIRDHTEPAYQCGRLLALLNDVQRAALNTTNATLVDRFFGSASTTPATVFGTLLRKAQPHLSKLRKAKPGLEHFFQGEIADVAARIDRFPTTLTPEQQGLFALGFYHQQHRPKADAADDGAQTDAAEATAA